MQTHASLLSRSRSTTLRGREWYGTPGDIQRRKPRTLTRALCRVLMASLTATVVALPLGCTDNDSPTGPPQLSLIISGISPSSGLPTGGNTVTISGRGFQPGATVTFADVHQFQEIAATGVRVLSSTSIAAIVPPQAQGGNLSVDVWVRNPDGKLYSMTNGYKYIDPDDENPWDY